MISCVVKKRSSDRSALVLRAIVTQVLIVEHPATTTVLSSGGRRVSVCFVYAGCRIVDHFYQFTEGYDGE